jgi:Xaa-Pro aminopeptidase
MDYQKRRRLLKEKLRRKNIDVLLVAQPENRRYLSGYQAADHSAQESSGVLLIPARGRSVLLTDFRYQVQAEQQSDLPVTLYRRGLLQLLQTLLGEYNTRTLGFESDYTLYSTSVKLAALAKRLHLNLTPCDNLVESMRIVKEAAELAVIRESVALNEQIFTDLFSSLSPEMSERQVARTIENMAFESGCDGISFAPIVAAGPSGAMPHAHPSASPIGRGRPITIDMGVRLNGYCSDMTRNFVLGDPDDTYLAVHRLVRKAQIAGIKAIREGVSVGQVDRAAREVIAKGGYGKYFGHALGHGVGLAVHEDPRLSGRSRRKLRRDMVVTVEPGIYLPGWGGVRLENMVIVREDHGEVINRDQTWLDI